MLKQGDVFTPPRSKCEWCNLKYVKELPTAVSRWRHIHDRLPSYQFAWACAIITNCHPYMPNWRVYPFTEKCIPPLKVLHIKIIVVWYIWQNYYTRLVLDCSMLSLRNYTLLVNPSSWNTRYRIENMAYHSVLLHWQIADSPSFNRCTDSTDWSCDRAALVVRRTAMASRSSTDITSAHSRQLPSMNSCSKYLQQSIQMSDQENCRDWLQVKTTSPIGIMPCQNIRS